MRLHDGEACLEVGPTRLEAKSLRFAADLPLELDVHEPANWAADLERMSQQGFGATTLRSHSGQFTATFAMAKKDELHVSVVLQDAPDFLHELRLFFNLPQAELPRIIREFRALVTHDT